MRLRAIALGLLLVAAACDSDEEIRKKTNERYAQAISQLERVMGVKLAAWSCSSAEWVNEHYVNNCTGRTEDGEIVAFACSTNYDRTIGCYVRVR